MANQNGECKRGTKEVRSMKGRKPTKAEQYHMDKVRSLGCIVCRKEGISINAEIHHVYGKTRQAKGDFRGAHFYVLPLCFNHHRAGRHEPPISRHPYKARFIKAYGSEQELLQEVEKLLENQEDNLIF